MFKREIMYLTASISYDVSKAVFGITSKLLSSLSTMEKM